MPRSARPVSPRPVRTCVIWLLSWPSIAVTPESPNSWPFCRSLDVVAVGHALLGELRARGGDDRVVGVDERGDLLGDLGRVDRGLRRVDRDRAARDALERQPHARERVLDDVGLGRRVDRDAVDLDLRVQVRERTVEVGVRRQLAGAQGRRVDGEVAALTGRARREDDLLVAELVLDDRGVDRRGLVGVDGRRDVGGSRVRGDGDRHRGRAHGGCRRSSASRRRRSTRSRSRAAPRKQAA